MKKFGFTLAEILVTLSIIGVVSALTVPALSQNVQNRTYEASIKKAYNTVSNAVDRYMADEGLSSLSNSEITTKNGLRSFVKKYFKVVQDCETTYYSSNGASCYAPQYFSLDKSATTNTAMGQCIIVVGLADGSSMCLDNGNMEDVPVDKDINGDGVIDENDKLHATQGIWDDDRIMSIEVDTNGPNGPNIVGRDIFSMQVNSRGLVYGADYGLSREAFIQKYRKNAWPMSISYLQKNGWRMDY